MYPADKKETGSTCRPKLGQTEYKTYSQRKVSGYGVRKFTGNRIRRTLDAIIQPKVHFFSSSLFSLVFTVAKVVMFPGPTVIQDEPAKMFETVLSNGQKNVHFDYCLSSHRKTGRFRTKSNL